MKAKITNIFVESGAPYQLTLEVQGFDMDPTPCQTAQEAFDRLPEGTPCDVFIVPKGKRPREAKNFALQTHAASLPPFTPEELEKPSEINWPCNR